MKKIISFVLSSFLLHIGLVQAQLDISQQNIEPQLPTWEASMFMRYGKITPSLYTGTVNYSIPFYTYKDNDFEIPISFDYASNGYKTNSRRGSLGHDWSLSAGGIITRQINGIPDEKIESVSNIQGAVTTVYGFSYAYEDINKDVSIESPLGYSSYFDSSNKINMAHIYNNKIYDPEPDLFSFNFMGYSGSFHFWYNGKIQILETSGFSTGIKVKFHIVNQKIAHITLTTPDGYKYQFGEGLSYDNFTEYFPQKDNNNITTIAWKLSSITAPNGREVSFNFGYKGLKKNNPIPKNYYYYMIIPNAEPSPPSDGLVLNNNTIISEPLTSITISGGANINLSYTLYNEEKFIYRGIIEKAFTNTELLDRISVEHNGNIIKTCDLKYKYSKSDTYLTSSVGNNVPFLSSVKISGEKAYELNYYDNNLLPYLGSLSYDHWGYYNGRSNSLDPEDITRFLFYNEYNYTETLNSTKKDPDPNFARLGMLRRIDYPTGGYTEFEYEPHDYWAYISRNAESHYSPELTNGNKNQVTGGLRIRKIINYDENYNFTDSLSYYYLNDNALSSGILINTPRYGLGYQAYNGLYSKSVKFYSLNNDVFPYNQTHIEYSKAIEKRSDGSSTSHYYTSSLTNQDELVYDGRGDNSNRIPTVYIDQNGYTNSMIFGVSSDSKRNLLVANILTPSLSQQSKRGKLWKTEVRDINGQLVQEVLTEYGFPVVLRYSVPLVTGEIWREVYHEDINIQVSKTTTRNYEISGRIEKETKYIYNNMGQTIEKQITINNGDILKTKYIYVTDFPYTENSIIYKEMNAAHLVGLPIEIFSLRNDKIISGIYNEYTRLKPGLFKSGQTYSLPNNINTALSYLCPGILTSTVSNTISIEDRNEYEASYAFSVENQTDVNFSLVLQHVLQIPTYEGFIFSIEKPDGYSVYSVHSSNLGSTTSNCTSGYKCYSYNNKVTLFPGDYIMRLRHSANLPGFKGKCNFSYDISSTGIARLQDFRAELNLKYDIYGNIKELKPINETPVVYLWSYSGQYAIAEIKNATYQDVETALGKALIDRVSTVIIPSDADIEAINDLRKNTGILKDAQITTYTYQPLVGMLTATDPSGTSTYYEYDTFGRLKRTKDADGKTIQEYDYHYQNQ